MSKKRAIFDKEIQDERESLSQRKQDILEIQQKKEDEFSQKEREFIEWEMRLQKEQSKVNPQLVALTHMDNKRVASLRSLKQAVWHCCAINP